MGADTGLAPNFGEHFPIFHESIAVETFQLNSKAFLLLKYCVKELHLEETTCEPVIVMSHGLIIQEIVFNRPQKKRDQEEYRRLCQLKYLFRTDAEINFQQSCVDFHRPMRTFYANLSLRHGKCCLICCANLSGKIFLDFHIVPKITYKSPIRCSQSSKKIC